MSLEVEAGTFLVLLGPSGSGKTTLLRCVAGIERITSGRIAIGGRTVADGRAHVPPDQRDLSMVFQDYALWPHLTAHDNVAFALRRRKLPRAAARDRAAAMLERVGLGALGRALPQRAVRGRAAAGRAGPRPGRRHRADPVRRAALQPRRGPAGTDAAGDLRAGPGGGGDHRLHHPRPGRGVRPGRPGRHAGTRAGWSSSAPRRRSTPARPRRSWPASPACPASSPVLVRRIIGDGHVEVEPSGAAQARPFRARGSQSAVRRRVPGC